MSECPLSPQIGSKTLPVTLLFTLTDQPGTLQTALLCFKRYSICLHHIESRPSKTDRALYDFMAEFNVESTEQLQKLLGTLKPVVNGVEVISSNPELRFNRTVDAIPWFPRRQSDLDQFASKTLEFGTELSADHPGFTDKAYRERRQEITSIAQKYKTGLPIPYIEYTEQEKATWKAVYSKVRQLHGKYACREHNYVFPLLEHNCGFSGDQIPQLEDVSKFLHDCTGFTLRPVMGLLSPRDFLNGLAFRVFHSTQYVRHHSKPFYTPEPDICHEMLGHVPLFADEDFAAFSQEIGLCSIGASDSDIDKLATIYWFTVEFGLCRQEGELKAYGAGLLSSYGELEYCVTDKATKEEFDPLIASTKGYPITEYQPHYFVADSFKSAQEKVKKFATTTDRPFSIRYNPYTQSIEVLDNKNSVLKFVQGIKEDLQILTEAIKKL